MSGTCAECRFWDEGDVLADEDSGVYFGQCRRYAPNGADIDAGGDAVWPTTKGSDWCGDWGRE